MREERLLLRPVHFPTKEEREFEYKRCQEIGNRIMYPIEFEFVFVHHCDSSYGLK